MFAIANPTSSLWQPARPSEIFDDFNRPFILPRVINFKFPLQPHQKYYITFYGEFGFSMWLNVNLGKVNLETCWPAVYLVGRPTCPQGLLVAHVLAGPALLHSPVVADQSQAIWPLCSPPPSPSKKIHSQTAEFACSNACVMAKIIKKKKTTQTVINFTLIFAASPEILHHTVWRTSLFIAHSGERWLYYQFSLPHL